MNVDFESFNELVEDVQVNKEDDKISSIEIKYPSYRLELFYYGSAWFVLPKIQLLERFYLDTSDIIEITNIKSMRIIGLQFVKNIEMMKNNEKNKPVKNYLYKIILENDLVSYFVIRSTCTMKNYKPLGVNLVNLEEEKWEKIYQKSIY